MFKINCDECKNNSIVISRPITDYVICPNCGTQVTEKGITEFQLPSELRNPLYDILNGLDAEPNKESELSEEST